MAFVTKRGASVHGAGILALGCNAYAAILTYYDRIPCDIPDHTINGRFPQPTPYGCNELPLIFYVAIAGFLATLALYVLAVVVLRQREQSSS